MEPENTLQSYYNHLLVGQLAEKLQSRTGILKVTCLRIIKAMKEFNASLADAALDQKQLSVSVLYILIVNHLSKACEMTQQLTIYVMELCTAGSHEEGWCPTLCPVDLNNYYNLENERLNGETILKTDYFEGLSLKNKYFILWGLICSALDETELLSELASYFLDMNNFKGDLSDIDNMINRQYLEITIQLSLVGTFNMLHGTFEQYKRELEELFEEIVCTNNSNEVISNDSGVISI